MQIRFGYDVLFDLPAQTPMLLMLNVHASRFASLHGPEAQRIEPHVPITFYTDAFGNTCGRMLAPAGQVRLHSDAIIEDCGLPDAVGYGAFQHPVQDLAPETLQFLLPSRYCEVDLLRDVAWSLFSNVAPGWDRVQAVCNWCHANIQFGYPFARATRTAAETYNERRGVCRDFAHLALALCRCLNIPARYATGYLGDIGVPRDPAPMDFSAWFEVYLGGQWWTVDARHNVPRIGRILMARGRDAVDVALITAFGPSQMRSFRVWTDEVKC